MKRDEFLAFAPDWGIRVIEREREREREEYDQNRAPPVTIKRKTFDAINFVNFGFDPLRRLYLSC